MKNKCSNKTKNLLNKSLKFKQRFYNYKNKSNKSSYQIKRI